jgi:predicted RNA polymerase sigma factor
LPVGLKPYAGRLGVVLQVLYLMFNEGYTASLRRHTAPSRPDRRGDAPGPDAHRAAPGDGEVAGLLALMLLTDARRTARTDADGFLVPLAE